MQHKKTYEFVVVPTVTAVTEVRASSLTLAVQAVQERDCMSLPAGAQGNLRQEWCTELDIDGCGLLPLYSAICEGEDITEEAQKVWVAAMQGPTEVERERCVKVCQEALQDMADVDTVALAQEVLKDVLRRIEGGQ